MIISQPGKFVFFANPKTGTTSIEEQLLPFATVLLGQDPNVKHIGVKKYTRVVEPFLARMQIDTKLDKIGVVRHPIDWLGSWYRYRSREEIRHTPNSTFGMSFEQFVESYLQDERPEFAKVGSPCGVLLNADGDLGVDYLYAYENLDGLAKNFSERLQTSIKFKYMNSSIPDELQLSPSVEQKLENYFIDSMRIYEKALR